MKAEFRALITKVCVLENHLSQSEVEVLHNMRDCSNISTYSPTQGQIDGIKLLLAKIGKKSSKKTKKSVKTLKISSSSSIITEKLK